MARPRQHSPAPARCCYLTPTSDTPVLRESALRRLRNAAQGSLVTNSGEAALVVTTHDNGAEVEVHALRDGRFSVRAPNRRPVVVDEPATALLAAENALEREAV